MRAASFHPLSLLAPAALSVLSLLSCGGGDPSPLPGPEEPVESIDRPSAALGAAMTARPAPYDCIDRLSHELQSTGMQGGARIGCLLGTYRGITERHEDCSLTIGVRGDRPVLARQGNAIRVDLLQPGLPGNPSLAIRRVDLDGGPIGLALQSRPAGPSNATESVEFTAREDTPPGRLDDMTYERAESGQLTFLHCRFHA